MREEEFSELMARWLEREAQNAPQPLPRSEDCLSWDEARQAAVRPKWREENPGRLSHAKSCEYCSRLLAAFERAGDARGKTTDFAEEASTVSGESAWERVSEGVLRLARDLEISFSGAGAAAPEPAMQFRWRGRGEAGDGLPPDEDLMGDAGRLERQTQTSMKAAFDFPEFGAGLEVEVEQEVPSMSVRVTARPIFPATEVPAGDFRVVYRRDTEERMACWLGRGDEMVIPNIEEGQFVIVVENKQGPCIYEIPLNLYM